MTFGKVFFLRRRDRILDFGLWIHRDLIDYTGKIPNFISSQPSLLSLDPSKTS